MESTRSGELQIADVLDTECAVVIGKGELIGALHSVQVVIACAVAWSGAANIGHPGCRSVRGALGDVRRFANLVAADPGESSSCAIPMDRLVHRRGTN